MFCFPGATAVGSVTCMFCFFCEGGGGAIDCFSANIIFCGMHYSQAKIMFGESIFSRKYRFLANTIFG